VSDRRAVEQAFLSHNISIICCTSTLAVGVNLPCYLVIVKGTAAWTDNGCQEYADLEMMQMLGRAGRPQFEQSACAVILTRTERADYYNRLVSGQEPLESCLHLNLIDHLNAEIGLGTVSDFISAKRWLASTFLFVRLARNPNHYRLKEGVATRNDDDLLEQICSKDVMLLQGEELVTRESKLSCTEFGDAMARYYVKFDTMKVLLALPPKTKLSETVSPIASADRFKLISTDVRHRTSCRVSRYTLEIWRKVTL
jgi:ATP-dependent DNA helicase HFM1/MER3